MASKRLIITGLVLIFLGMILLSRGCRSADRYCITPGDRDDDLGFRLLRTG